MMCHRPDVEELRHKLADERAKNRALQGLPPCGSYTDGQHRFEAQMQTGSWCACGAYNPEEQP